MTDFSFNLADQPWIPCTDLTGEQRLLGLREILQYAHELRTIEALNPLTEAALMRVLLAVVHRIAQGPRSLSQWQQMYQTQCLPTDRIDAYFQKWRHRFDLLSSEAPFYQTPGLRILDKAGAPAPVSITGLMLEKASGNNKTLFDHAADDRRAALSPAEAARTLITAQMYSLGGLNKKTTNLFGFQQSYLNASLVNGNLVLLQGRNLFEQLLLNLFVYRDNEPMPSSAEDCPVWERTDIGGTGIATPKGYLDYLTCKSRHIRLVPEHDGTGIHVAKAHIAQAEAFPEVLNPAGIRRLNASNFARPLQLDTERPVWRNSLALLAFTNTADDRPRALQQAGAAMKSGIPVSTALLHCMIYGLVNNKANPLAWRKEVLSIPTAMVTEHELVERLRKGIEVSEAAGGGLEGTAQIFMRAVLPGNTRESEIRHKVQATGVLRHYWDLLERPFQQFLLDIGNGNTALTTWEARVKGQARAAFENCLRQRCAVTAKTYRAWIQANRFLNGRLTELHCIGG